MFIIGSILVLVLGSWICENNTPAVVLINPDTKLRTTPLTEGEMTGIIIGAIGLVGLVVSCIYALLH